MVNWTETNEEGETGMGLARGGPETPNLKIKILCKLEVNENGTILIHR